MSFFFTGFPGFIATQLIKKLARRDPRERFELLAHPSQVEKAHAGISRLVAGGYGTSERFNIIPGDIRQEALTLDSHTMLQLQLEVTRVFHLAAVYDLAVSWDAASWVNVDGTRHVNHFVRQLPHLKRYVYFSTAFVSGKRTGRVLETELDAGQSFKNFYEETKFEAEKLVQEIMGTVPTTIVRPGVAVGDSKTGETARFDGPYFIMRFLDRFRALPVPLIGKEVPFNIVPVDYIVNAVTHLAFADAAVNKVYHLTDPSPRTAAEVYGLICQELIGKRPSWTIPTALVSTGLSVPLFRKWVGAEKEAVMYMHWPVEYDSTRAQADLKDSGIRCPDLKSYIGECVEYYKQHRQDEDKRVRVK